MWKMSKDECASNEYLAPTIELISFNTSELVSTSLPDVGASELFN
ncbi:MAG: hypothetical protein PHV32_11285 [Eubacteriales bacterium]|nr:hypothetical protein [Eubacteriales bacterium]